MDTKKLHAKEQPAGEAKAPKPFQIEEHTHAGWTIQAVEYHVQVKPRHGKASFHFVTTLRAAFPGVASPVAFTVNEPMSQALRTMQLILDEKAAAIAAAALPKPAPQAPQLRPLPDPEPTAPLAGEITPAAQLRLHRLTRRVSTECVHRITHGRARPILILDTLGREWEGDYRPAARLLVERRAA